MGDQINFELVHDLRAGSQIAFDTIFKKYYKLLCFEGRGYFKNNNLIEEIVCDVFTKIWQNRAEFTISTSLREYLVKAVRNNCVNYYRTQKAQENLKYAVEENQKKSYSLIDIGQDPLEYTIANELEIHIAEAIESLPKRYKQAFKLSRYEDMTYEEIAVEMGISINGVKINIKKALEHLREKLKDYLIIIFILLSLSLYKLFF